MAQKLIDSSRMETAIVFGAGASMPPLLGQQGLVEQLASVRGQPRIESAQKYLQTAFPGGPNKTLRFEDIVGPLEIAEAEEYWFHFAGRDLPGNVIVTNQEVLDSLDTWVAMCLDPDSLPKPKEAKKGTAKTNDSYSSYYRPTRKSPLAYSRLVRLLLDAGQLEQTAFISMNYDVLLDRVLFASEAYTPEYSIDGFYENRNPPETKKTLLLKLHGSLNWRSCDQCHILRNLGPFVVWPQSHCIDCNSKRARPMLIRPTLLKDFRHRVWQEVWRAAGHVLASARKWVFVGYSLPLADVWMLRLLAQSLKSGGIAPKSREIIVVNPEAATRERFAVLFPRLTFDQQKFEDWLAKCETRGGLK